jgi:hypothetical protein
MNTNGKSEIHIIDAGSGKLLNAISATSVKVFTDPKFIDAHTLVSAIRLNDGKMALASIDITSGTITQLSPSSFNVIGFPCVNNALVYFTASYEGNDDVFALRLSDKSIARISNGPLGNYYVNARNGKVTWSSFTAHGYKLIQINEQDISWNEINKGIAEKMEEDINANQPKLNTDILSDKIPQRNFIVSNYKKGTRLLNFHSWRPNYEDPIFTFSVYGQNVLNTLQTELYYLYNQNEKTSSVGFGTTYGGWFPYVNVATEYTFDRHAINGNNIRSWNQLDSRV